MRNYWGLQQLIKKSSALIMAVFVFGYFSSAVAAETTVKLSNVKKQEKTAQEKKDKATKNTNQSVAQGLSVAESMLARDNPWSYFFSTSISRGLDEYQDTLDNDYSVSLGYRLNSWSALGLNAGFSTIMYKKDGELFNNEDNDELNQYGFNDIDVTYTIPRVWSDKYNNLVLNTAISLPTSRAARRSSMNVEGRVSAAMRYRPNSKIIITPAVSTYGRHFTYDYENESGTLVNSPFGFGYSLSASYMFTTKLIGSVSYGQTQRYTYLSEWRPIQTAVFQASYSATDAINVFAGYRWRDLTVTNESVFDDDTSIIYTGAGYAF